LQSSNLQIEGKKNDFDKLDKNKSGKIDNQSFRFFAPTRAAYCETSSTIQ